MKHDLIFYYFKQHLPYQAKSMIEWFTNGRNSIRVRLTSKEDFIFTYNGERNWCFETLDNYIVRMKGDKQMRC